MTKKQNASQQIEIKSSKTPYKPIPKDSWVKTDTLDISFDPNNLSILVTEQPPLPHRIAFCGGGSRIPAHIGAYEELVKRGLRFTEFSGSSAGALIATFAYLGYSCAKINEIISWFDEDKLLENPFSFNINTLKQIIYKGGISSAKFLHQAANYVVLEKVMRVISDEKYKSRFAKYLDFLKENVFDCPTCITFETLAKIKQICPECEIGERLFIVGSDLSTQQPEIFSAETTPKMGVADAIIISANLPIAFERISYNGKEYSDGGITINYPIHCFPRKMDDFLLRHKLNVDYSVIGVQFDNGHEKKALYSEKPLYKWPWLSSKFYAYVTGHETTTDNWHKDLKELRRHAQQSILIKTPGISFGKLTLSDEVHHNCIESGRVAARNYLDHHGYYIDSSMTTLRNEWLYEKFDSPEELLHYCYERRNSEVLEKIQGAISLCTYLEKGYRQYLLDLCEKMLLTAKTWVKEDVEIGKTKPILDKIFEEDSKPREETISALTFFSPSTKDVHLLKDNKSALQIRLYTKLYPILMQNWQKLCPVSGIDKILDTTRVSLMTVDSAHRCFQLLIKKLQDITSGHFLVFIFKTALKHYEEYNFDFLLKNLKYLYKALGITQKKQIHSDDKYYGHWDFDEQDPKKILQALKNDDISLLNDLLEIKRAPALIKRI